MRTLFLGRGWGSSSAYTKEEGGEKKRLKKFNALHLFIQKIIVKLEMLFMAIFH